MSIAKDDNERERVSKPSKTVPNVMFAAQFPLVERIHPGGN